jgi:hypothetical protein
MATHGIRRTGHIIRFKGQDRLLAEQLEIVAGVRKTVTKYHHGVEVLSSGTR